MKIEIELKEYALLVRALFAYESYLNQQLHLHHDSKSIKAIKDKLSKVSKVISKVKKQE